MKNLIEKYEHEITEELSKEGTWVHRSFGGVWQGVLYAAIVAWGIILYGAIGSYHLPIATTVWLAVQFWCMVAYDKTLVSYWNQYERDRIIAQWLHKNIDRVKDDVTQVTVIKGNLDGTSGDE